MVFNTHNLRTYGAAPYSVAVIHGGPGVAGEMKPVARELSDVCGILEPLQTANSIEGQVEELLKVLKENARIPATLIGHSWGAWLSFILTARYPDLVKKLILVASGPFKERYVVGLMKARLGRLKQKDQREILTVIEKLNDPGRNDKNELFTRFGKLLSQADSFDPLPEGDIDVKFDAGIFQQVWKEAEQLRRSGELFNLGRKIQCPVIAIHGDYDPHPAEGVNEPLSRVVKNFRFVLLRHCGHKPWIEKQAVKEFYRILREEIRETDLA
jgi:pimeloyl-ACP methyl ester carboxylesterase